MQSQLRQTVLDALAKAQHEVTQRQEELRKTHRRTGLQHLVAPADGTVQQLSIHTVGGVVEAVRPLMVIVPEGVAMVEAEVRNSEAGFIRPGQAVTVKMDAFPFTRYGTVPGQVMTVSHDSVQVGRGPAVFVVRIALLRTRMDIEGNAMPLSAGLEASCDIMVGSRRIIDYLLGPIEEMKQSAAREK